MSSLVTELQRHAIDSKKSVTELLRMVKLIAAKLDLPEIKGWVDSELNGYTDASTLPAYRWINATAVEVRNPVRGWQFAGHVNRRLPVLQPISQVEELAKSECAFPLVGANKLPMMDQIGSRHDEWPQQMRIDSTKISGVLDAIRNKVVDWSAELEKRGIMGENMSFNPTERQSAHQSISIQNFTGVLGTVTNSAVTIYDYSTIHQALKEQNVSQQERNELENIMDELKKTPPEQRPPLLERAKAWLVKNESFLGATVSLVRKACGI